MSNIYKECALYNSLKSSQWSKRLRYKVTPSFYEYCKLRNPKITVKKKKMKQKKGGGNVNENFKFSENSMEIISLV